MGLNPMSATRDYNKRESWQLVYGLRGGYPEYPGFLEQIDYLDGRKHALQLSKDGKPGLAHFRLRLDKIVNVISLDDKKILVVGCGFGWLMEVMVDAGYTDVIGTDTSTLIQSLKSNPETDVRPDIQRLILDVDITKDTSGLGPFDVVITEHLLEDWSVNRLSKILDACESLLADGGEVLHIITNIREGQETVILNKFDLDDWIAFQPMHYWLEDSIGLFGGGQ